MSQLAAAMNALDGGDLERAKSLLVQSYDEAPGAVAAALAKIALRQNDAARAEAISRTALENHAPEAIITLADAVGRQGRRAEAEQLALDAINRFSDSGPLRAVLGEQRIRQANWELGTQDFVDAFSLDGRDEVIEHLFRVLSDLTIGHRAGKVPSDRAIAFIRRIGSNIANAPELEPALAAALGAIERKEVFSLTPPPARRRAPTGPPARSRPNQAPPPPPQPAAAPRMPRPSGVVPDLVAVMRRDRELNDQLQSELAPLGLPDWPSRHTEMLDVIEPMVPKKLEIDREEFQREHLNVTSGSVASEIIIERALQLLLQEIGSTTASVPDFNEVGLTQLEMALWDGALERMHPIPPIYLGEQTDADARVLAIGGFLGACVVNPGEATWSFARRAAESTIETYSEELEPFRTAAAWLAAENKDDVSLHEFLAHARKTIGLGPRSNARLDPTEGLQGTALAMKLAELWLNFREHDLDTAQTSVAAAIRPLHIEPTVIVFALGHAFAPTDPLGRRPRGEVAVAYVRATTEFLLLSSRKHFARACGELIGAIDSDSAGVVLSLFSRFHAPTAEIPRQGDHAPRLERSGDATILRFRATTGRTARDYAFAHAPSAAVRWQLLEV